MKKNEEGLESLNSLEILRKLIVKKINLLRKKRFNESSIDEFDTAFRVFIMRYLQIEYEFTEEELLKELNKKNLIKALKEQLLNIAVKLSQIKYEGKKINKKEFIEMLNLTESTINLAIDRKENKILVLKNSFKNEFFKNLKYFFKQKEV